MSLKVATWNTLRGLADEARSNEQLELIKHMDADVALFTEAYGDTEESALAPALDVLSGLGYLLKTATYDDHDERQDRHGYLAISRVSSEFRVMSLFSRSVIAGMIIDPDTFEPIEFVGAHLDDRAESRRIKAVEDLPSIIGRQGPAIFAGDLNTFDGASRRAHLVRRLAPVAHLLENGEPVFGAEYKSLRDKFARAGSLGRRMGEMAEGTAFAALQKQGFTDADALQQPTYSFRSHDLLQLDHIMTRELVVSDFTVYADRCGSDHYAISATITA
jgi:endonuclease/exonuclease/phosphatase family metal-dependent hydrolase